MQSASEQVIPAGMKPWSGGDSAPEDWDKDGPVMLSGGFTFCQSDQQDPIYWGHDHDDIDSDIIAYTPLPSPAPMVEQAGEVERVTKAAQAAEARYAEMYPEHADRIENIISAYTFDTPADRCRAHEVARAMGGHPRLNTRPAPAETEGVERFADDVTDVHSRIIIVHQLRASAEIQDRETKKRTGWADTNDRATLMRKAADTIERIASTPPADAGMLDDIEEIEMGLSLGLNEASRAPAGFRISILARTIQQARKGLAALQTKEAAALNSQAHQIREGDHG